MIMIIMIMGNWVVIFFYSREEKRKATFQSALSPSLFWGFRISFHLYYCICRWAFGKKAKKKGGGEKRKGVLICPRIDTCFGFLNRIIAVGIVFPIPNWGLARGKTPLPAEVWSLCCSVLIIACCSICWFDSSHLLFSSCSSLFLFKFFWNHSSSLPYFYFFFIDWFSLPLLHWVRGKSWLFPRIFRSLPLWITFDRFRLVGTIFWRYSLYIWMFWVWDLLVFSFGSPVSTTLLLSCPWRSQFSRDKITGFSVLQPTHLQKTRCLTEISPPSRFCFAGKLIKW